MQIFRENISLSADDFSDCPFWHWCEADADVKKYPDDIDTASTFHAHDGAYPVPTTAYGYAAAAAHTNDGRIFPACIFCSGELESAGAAMLLHPKGQIDFRHTIVGESSDRLTQQITWLTNGDPNRLMDCFPITCQVNQGVLDADVSIEIPGFHCIHIIDGDFQRRIVPPKA